MIHPQKLMIMLQNNTVKSVQIWWNQQTLTLTQWRDRRWVEIWWYTLNWRNKGRWWSTVGGDRRRSREIDGGRGRSTAVADDRRRWKLEPGNEKMEMRWGVRYECVGLEMGKWKVENTNKVFSNVSLKMKKRNFCFLGKLF